jgi:hypothetical protein
MEEFFSVVGDNGESFPPLWDTKEEVFSIVGYNGEQSLDGQKKFFRCIPQRRNFSSVVSYTTTEAYAVYCIPLHRNFFCTVSHTEE